MNGRKAKLLRKQVYGECGSIRGTEYGVVRVMKRIFGKGYEQGVVVSRDTCVTKGKRKEYQEAKKKYKVSGEGDNQ